MLLRKKIEKIHIYLKGNYDHTGFNHNESKIIFLIKPILRIRLCNASEKGQKDMIYFIHTTRRGLDISKNQYGYDYYCMGLSYAEHRLA